MEELRTSHTNEFVVEEPRLTSIRTVPAFAIGQRAFLVETPEGNVLWDCVSLLDEDTVLSVLARGKPMAMAVSHPHFYATMVEWARALQVPVWLHEADRAWVERPDPVLHFWSGASKRLGSGLTLVRTGGHFEGSQVLHWAGGAGGSGVLLAGDEPNVCADRRWVTFMRSFPNFIPLGESKAEGVAMALRELSFDRLYGWAPGRQIRSDAKRIVERSLERHLRALRGHHACPED
jgi:hypothetical protein